ncbi:MAG: flippase [Alphaproteobacteria bacterium]|nr:flippase [Alphaproteobacteria bacterium]
MALTESESRGRLARMSPAALAAQTRAWLKDGGHHSIAQRVAGAAFMIRVASAGIIYLSQILLARWMGTHEFGIYVYVWTLVLLLGDLSDFGLSSAAQRFVPEYRRSNANDLLRGFISRSRWIACGSAIVIAAIGATTVHLLRDYIPAYLALPVSIAFVTLPFFTVMQVQDGIARSHNWINLALLPPFVVRHVVILALVLAAYLLSFPATAVTAVIAVAIAFTVTTLVQTVILNRRLARTVEPGPKAYETKTWIAVSLPILMVEGFYMLLTNTDILLLQYFRSPQDVAIYYAAAKTLILVAFVHFAVAAAVAHRFSEYHVSGDREQLKAILADSVRWTFWFSLAAAVVVLAAGKFLLSLFGAHFVEGYHLMFILAIGVLSRAAIGPVERLLSMLGEQRICAAVFATTFFLNVGLGIAMIPRWGVNGAAASTAIALVFESVLLYVVTRRRLRLHAFAFGRPAAG